MMKGLYARLALRQFDKFCQIGPCMEVPHIGVASRAPVDTQA